MSGPLGGTSASGGGGVGGSQNNAPRSRRRKNQSSRNNRTQTTSAGHPNQMGFGSGPTAGGTHQQFGGGPLRGGPGGHLNNQMPPPGMLPHPPQSTGMGWGLSIDEDPVDFILDDLDKLSGRDIASARYRRNHELINLIFDARKIESLQPSDSYYADKDQDALRTQLTETQDAIEKLQSTHSTKFKRWRQELQEHDDLLHAPPKRIKAQLEEEEKKRLEEADIEEVNANGEPIESWKQMPSKGRILGSGYIRAKTPEEVRKLLPKAPEPEPEPQPEQKPAVIAPTQAQSTAPTPTTSQPLEAVSGVQQPIVGADATPIQQGQSDIPSLPQASLPTQPSNLTDAMQLDGDAEGDEEDEEEDGSGQEEEDDDDEEGDEDDGDAEADEDAPEDEDAEADAEDSNAVPGESITNQSAAASEPIVEGLESLDASMAVVGDDTFATAADETQDAANGAVISAEGIANINNADMSTNDVIDQEPQSEAKDVVQKSMDAIPPVETIEAIPTGEKQSSLNEGGNDIVQVEPLTALEESSS